MLDGRGRQAGVEAQAGLGVRAEPGRAAEGADLDDAAERVAIGRGRVDRREHALPRRSASEQPISLSRARAKAASSPASGCGLDVADGQHAAEARAMPSSASRPFAIAPDRDARRGLARRGALEHVAHVVELVLHDAREVGVARAAAAAPCGCGARRPRPAPPR